MKKLFILFAIAIFARITAAQTTVNYQSWSITGQTNNRAVTITLRTQGQFFGNGIVSGVPKTITPTNGSFSVSLLPLTYLVNIDGVGKTFTMPVPNTPTNAWNMIDLINNGLVMDIQSAAIAAGANVTITTNYVAGKPVITINASGGGGSSTNITNFTATGSSMTITNPGGNTVVLNFSGNSTMGGGTQTIQTSPAGIQIGTMFVNGSGVTAGTFYGALSGNAATATFATNAGTATNLVGNAAGATNLNYLAITSATNMVPDGLVYSTGCLGNANGEYDGIPVQAGHYYMVTEVGPYDSQIHLSASCVNSPKTFATLGNIFQPDGNTVNLTGSGGAAVGQLVGVQFIEVNPGTIAANFISPLFADGMNWTGGPGSIPNAALGPGIQFQDAPLNVYADTGELENFITSSNTANFSTLSLCRVGTGLGFVDINFFTAPNEDAIPFGTTLHGAIGHAANGTTFPYSQGMYFECYGGAESWFFLSAAGIYGGAWNPTTDRGDFAWWHDYTTGGTNLQYVIDRPSWYVTNYANESVRSNLLVGGLATFTNGISSLLSNKLALTTISVGSSPFNWTNTIGGNLKVHIGGGIVSAIAINGTTIASGMTLTADSPIDLQTNEYVTVTYSSLPTMTRKPL